MKVLVLGASGFIGNPVAQAISRAGHIVYGSTRSAGTAESLAKDEILPVVMDAATEEGTKELARLADEVDVVIDTVPAMGPDAPLSTFHTVVKAAEKRPADAKLTYIYTGGSWVHSRGDAGGLEKWTDERQPYGDGVQLTQWRWKVEEQVLTSQAVHGVVIRPSVLYGKSGSLTAILVFGPAVKAGKGQTFEAVGKKDTRLLTIHTDDLAELYLRVAERGPICRGQAFIGANPQSERLADIFDAAARVTGAAGYTLRGPNNPFEEAWCSTTQAKPSLGDALTGWRPRKMSLVDGMDVYYAAYNAASASGK